VFLVGDSVDRMMIERWCDDLERTYGKVVERVFFAEGVLKYSTSTSVTASSMMCKVDNATSLSFVHIFGSSDKGPYMSGAGINLDAYTNSEDRVAIAFSLYFTHVPWPDRVFLHTAMWDLNYFKQDVFPDRNTDIDPSSSYYKEAMSHFINGTHSRLEQLEDILQVQRAKLELNVSINLGLRTLPWGSQGGTVLHGFNDLIRLIASQRGLSLYDFDRDAWFSTFSIATGGSQNLILSSEDVPSYHPNFEFEILQDPVHPSLLVSLSGAQKIMGSKYSKFVRFAGPMAKFWSDRFLDPFSDDVSKALFVREVITFPSNGSTSNASPTIYCLHVHASGLRHVAHHAFLQMTHFWQGDVMDVEAAVLERYKIGRPLLNADSSSSNWGIVMHREVDEIFQVVGGVRYAAASSASFLASKNKYNVTLALSESEESLEEASFWVNTLLPVVGNCPSFVDKSLVQIKGQQAVYVIHKKTNLRQSLPCWNYVYAFGLDPGAVQTYDDFMLFQVCFPEDVLLERAGVCRRRRHKG